ncbi:hypothetical protein NQ315_016560 [Exocentrus adspersus]|uniref:ATPase AAA-type core domain-containing protein n=1 Tax=Exocentrus adspersus TaxID=1586481 RepID=A0AAV8W0B5_9CUCU|nr:hypothetical protein NQ315_016560 [Exocentrus adspersus]
MSFEYYVDWWITARNKFDDLYQRDEAWRNKAKPLKDRKLANKLLGGFYVKYSTLVQELDTCLDQIAQPQKRFTMRKLVDAATVRLCEFNDELRKVDFSEYHYVDDNLVELKKLKKGEKIYIPPEPVPEETHLDENALSENPTEGQPPEGQQAEAKTDEKAEKKEAKVKEKKGKRPKQQFVTEEKQLTAEELAEIQRKLKKIAETKQVPKPIDPELAEVASIKIQAVWKGHTARQLTKRNEAERRLLIGMTEPSWRSKEEFEILEKNLNKRRAYRDERIREYIEAIDKEKARVLRVIAPGLAEDIGDEIREWFYQWYIRAGAFDKYPPEAKGGTVLVVRGETMTPEEYLADVLRRQKEKEKNKGADKEKAKKEKEKKLAEEKKKKEQEKKKKEAEAKKKKKKKITEYEYEYGDTFAKPLYDEGHRELLEIWDQRNDLENPLEKHYMDLITDNECYLLQLSVRKVIDELMVLELDLLVEALEKDKARRKGKKYKKKKSKKKKGKKKKKKGKKDPTANRSTEDLFQELVDCGIIRQYPVVKLADYKGDFSYKNWDLRNMQFDPPATFLDVRQAVVLNCIMPLGVEVMKRPRSVLICGPRQTGKHLLANAIFNETQCVLFDLSPENTAGKYPGGKGMKMLIHLISKMSKLLAPSIIYFDAAEKIFYKKVPKDEKSLDPKRIGKKLFKGIIKTITAADRVLVLGVTSKPWAAQAAKMKKTFERNILVPRPDYGSVYLYWRELLMAYHVVDRNIDVTSLVTVTLNYPFPVIKYAVEQVMTPRRIIQLSYNPLRQEELYEILVSEGLEPITDKEYNKYLKWYFKTPLGKQRNAFNKVAEAEREVERAAKEKAEKARKK